MPSQLDLAIDATINRLMADDGPLAVTYAQEKRTEDDTCGVQSPCKLVITHLL